MTDPGNLLVVDDMPDNLRLLSAMLAQRGYKVRKALNGKIALATAQRVPPDLILLDINMPGANGYEVCQQLKANPKTQEIPVIFISALDDVFDKVKAFQVGGVDYIAKPFHEEEAIARIEHQLTIRRQQKELQQKNEQLQQEIKERRKAEDALRVYLHAVSHDLRNPVTAMSMVVKGLLARPPLETREIAVPQAYLERMDRSCDRQLNLINSLVETQQLEVWGVPLQCRPLHLSQLVSELAAEWEPRLAQHEARLENLVAHDIPAIEADYHQLWRVYENLVANALKHNPTGVQLTLSAELHESQDNDSRGAFVRCLVADTGVGLEPEQIETLFELYQRGQAARKTTGLGLGLYLCRKIVTAHGGEIGAISSPGAGAKFWFTLPIFEKKEA